MGRQAPLRCCWRTAPTAVSEASVIRQVGALGVGYERREASARAFLVARKEATAASVQVRVWDLALPEERRECRGCMRSAPCGRKR